MVWFSETEILFFVWCWPPSSNLTGKIESFFTFILRLHWHIFPSDSPPSSLHSTLQAVFSSLYQPGSQGWDLSLLEYQRPQSLQAVVAECQIACSEQGQARWGGRCYQHKVWSWTKSETQVEMGHSQTGTQTVPLSPPVTLVSLTVWPLGIIQLTNHIKEKIKIQSRMILDIGWWEENSQVRYKTESRKVLADGQPEYGKFLLSRLQV